MKKYFKLLIILIIILIVVLIMLFVIKKYIVNQDPVGDAAQTQESAEVIQEGKDYEESAETVSSEEVDLSADKIEDYKYDFELVLNTDDMTIDGVLNFTYFNNNETPMDELVFYLYANSFEKQEYHAVEEDNFDNGYPNGFSPGSIEIKDIDIQGGGSFEVTGSQNHLLVVTLDNMVEPEGITHLTIEYKITIPNSYGRFGYGEQTISIVNCNPIMAVYDEQTGYYTYEYNNIGDPFFSECADYTAQITLPEGYLIAPTGTITGETHQEGQVTYKVDGENRRDFGFVASDDFDVLSQESNGVTIYSYSFTGGSVNEKALQSAVDAIDVYSDVYGDYPYETFNVVEANFYIGGMEYPGMVMIDDGYYLSSRQGIMEMIIIHEAAHQWWYAMVGNDQIAEPWLDEALATFSEKVYYERVYPGDYKDLIFDYIDNFFIKRNRNLENKDSRIDLNTMEYGDEYSVVVYGFGCWMLDDLREELGEEVFFAALRKYLSDNKYQVATREDLENAIEAITGEDITYWFDEHLQVQVGY